MAAINVTEDTHAQIKALTYQLLAEGVVTNIGDVGDHLWDYVRAQHLEDFEGFVRDNVAARGS